MSLKELIADIYPLSSMQEGMLFHTLYAPHSGVYLLQTICSLEGDLDLAVFQRAWSRALERHSILRTAFLWENLERPMQVVYREAEVPFEVLDYRARTEAERTAERRDFLARDRSRGFELSKPPILRLALLRLGEREHELVFTYHHLLLDAWSIAPLMGEVFADYAALRSARELALPQRRPYRDYIAWLEAQDLSRAEAFWRRQLAGWSAPTPIPSDRPPSQEPSPPEAYSTLSYSLGAALTAKLEGLARRRQVTLNAVVQSSWALLLGRYSGEREVLYGLVTSGRPTDLRGAESMIGLFINTLPMRLELAPRTAVSELWRQLQMQQAEIQGYEYSPLVKVHGWSEVPRSQPLFESIFIFANYLVPGAEDLDSGLIVHGTHTVERSNFPLTVDACLEEERLRLLVYYELERFDPPTVLRMLRHLERLAEAMAAAPEARLAELTPLTSAERQQLVAEWNEVASAPVAETLHRRFEEQVEHCGEATAVVFAASALSYRELDRRAARLACRLRELGVGCGGAEVLVALCVERSLDLVVAILGALKAGGAYLPLDPDLPPARLRFILEDGAPQVLVTQELLLGKLPQLELPTVCLDRDREHLDRRPPEPFAAGGRRRDPDPRSPAYVIYTSGSTGRPKGTPVSHVNVRRLFTATEPWYGFGPQDVWTLFHSYAFDFTVWEIWGALSYGGRLVVVPREAVRSPEAFYDLLAEERVTVLNQTPSAFRYLVRVTAGGRAVELALRWVVFGGEAVDLGSLVRWFERHGDRRPRLVNMYGITETTVHVTWRPLRQADPAGPVRSPIGVPIPDLELHVTDSGLGPRPIGIRGELHVAGAGLARGYLGRPALTAERFVPHPMSRRPGARLYRTGDLGRRLADGSVEYLGRLDHQVKIRGFRIELGEVEAVLAEHPAVRQAVAAVHGGPAGPALAAYVVARDTMPPAGELRDFLRQRLPEYMVPSAFVALDELPLTATGKLNRRALPEPEGLRPDIATEYVAPQSELERLIAAIWCDVLELDKVGAHDNFFEVGGHSLAMVAAVGKLRQSLGRRISIIDAFRYPSVHQLAAYLSAEDAAPSAAEQRRQVASRLAGGKERRKERLARQRRARRERGTPR